MDLDAPDDLALLQAYAAGDAQAFERLYDRHDRSSYRFVRRLLGEAHADAAEDCHQDAWVAVARNAATFDPSKSSFPTWLFTIARHKVWDHLRRLKVATLASAHDDAAMSVPDPGLTPLQQVQSRELAQEIVSALDALPLGQREVFLMFVEGGLSLEEIAQVTGATFETAKSRLRYAREKLRQSLAAERAANV